jgi:hypothetical protein
LRPVSQAYVLTHDGSVFPSRSSRQEATRVGSRLDAGFTRRGEPVRQDYFSNGAAWDFKSDQDYRASKGGRGEGSGRKERAGRSGRFDVLLAAST